MDKTSYLSDAETPAVTPAANAGGACALETLGVIRAVGADAASFLHGQLSNDVQRLDRQHARLGAYCTPQGRMLASFVYAKTGPQELWLSCSADVLPTTLKRLSMFVMRAKAKLSDASAELRSVGLVGHTAAAWLTQAGLLPKDEVWSAVTEHADHAEVCVIRLPDSGVAPRWLWIGPAAAAEAVLAALPALAHTQWQDLEVRSGVVPVSAATAGLFVPQMLNYELVGGVDFKKGCYPGQEIVARSQYLGKLKRRAFLLSSPEEARAGQEIFWSEDPEQPAGAVAHASAHAGRPCVVAELKINAIQQGTLHLDRADGPVLTLLALPYALPQNTPPAQPAGAEAKA